MSVTTLTHDAREHPWIDAMWLQRAGTPAAAPQRILPDGAIDIIAFVHDTGRRLDGVELCLFGARERFEQVDVDSRFTLLGLRLRPGCAASALGLPARAISGLTLPLGELGQRFISPFDRVHTARNVAELGAIMLQSCRALQADHAARHPRHEARSQALVDHVLRCDGDVRLSTLAGCFPVSDRAARRNIEDIVGLAPKQLARIARFQAACRRLQFAPQQGLAQIAAACGYADQAHMTREFTDLAGLTPGALKSTLHVGRNIQEAAGDDAHTAAVRHC